VTTLVTKERSAGTNHTRGKVGDVPVSGDYEGDGKTDIGVFRRANRIWDVRQSGNCDLLKQWEMGANVLVVNRCADLSLLGKVDLAGLRHTWKANGADSFSETICPFYSLYVGLFA
jgi:hypothetical protein